MSITSTARGARLLGAAAVVAAGLAGGCGPDNPTITAAPPYQPPPTTIAPPQTKGADGKAQPYGSDPGYQNAMQKMNASQGLGR